jgi:hypothetical protein
VSDIWKDSSEFWGTLGSILMLESDSGPIFPRMKIPCVVPNHDWMYSVYDSAEDIHDKLPLHCGASQFV